MTQQTAVIVGAGPGLSAAVARCFAATGMTVALAARDAAKLAALAAETGGRAYACDVVDEAQVADLFAAVAREIGEPDVVVYNAARRLRGPIEQLDSEAVRAALMVNAFGGFLVGREAARRMLVKGSGSILFTGATASVKGYAGSAPFAMGKFALRGLVQSLARELAPKGIHVAHVIVDGIIADERRPQTEDDSRLDPGAIAEAYLHLHRQHRSAWTWEVELRPWLEKF